MTTLLNTSKPSVIVGNYGNDTIALVQWAYEHGLSHIQVVSVDTGWAGEGWLQYVVRAEQWVQSLGFTVIRLVALPNFAELMQQRHAFPSTKFQWCANILKGSTLLSWLDKVDPAGAYQVLIGHRRASSRSKQNLPSHIPSSEAFGERSVFYPLVALSTEDRNILLQRAGFAVLSHRSLECDPCVNSTLVDLARVPAAIVTRQEKLEDKLDKKMLPLTVENAGKLTKITQATATDVLENMGCGDSYGCGI